MDDHSTDVGVRVEDILRVRISSEDNQIKIKYDNRLTGLIYYIYIIIQVFMNTGGKKLKHNYIKYFNMYT